MNKLNLYPVGRVPIYAYFKLFHRLEIVGKENVPKQGGVLLCGNHINILDPPLVGAASPRDVHFMAKAELFEVPVLKSLLPQIKAFPVKRGAVDRQALKTGLKVLEEGKVLGLFPEGTRSKDGKIGKALAGAGFFALKSNAYVVPCGVIGSYKSFTKIKVVFGKPIPFSEMRQSKVSAQEAAGTIMESVRLLVENENSKA